MSPARTLALVLASAAAGGLGAGLAVEARGEPAKSEAPSLPIRGEMTSRVVPHAKLVKAVMQRRAADRRVRSLRATLRRSPDAELSLRIAGIVYGQDWRAMRSCWLSEGYRNAERRERRIVRLNRQGSGASGPGQFMPSTWRSTPFGHLDIFSVQAQAFATAWMWSRGMRNHWAGEGC